MIDGRNVENLFCSSFCNDRFMTKPISPASEKCSTLKNMNLLSKRIEFAPSFLLTANFYLLV